MAEKAFEIVVPARVSEANALVAAVAAAARARGLDAEGARRLELAVEEMAVNICHHAQAGAPGEIQVRVWDDEESVTAEISHEGPAFDPRSVPPPDTTTSLEERRPGGLGVFLTRQVLEEMHYERQGERNLLRMVVRKSVG